MTNDGSRYNPYHPKVVALPFAVSPTVAKRTFTEYNERVLNEQATPNMLCRIWPFGGILPDEEAEYVKQQQAAGVHDVASHLVYHLRKMKAVEGRD